MSGQNAGRNDPRFGQLTPRDGATVRAAMRHYATRGLITVADYEAVPGIAGVEANEQRSVTVYSERFLSIAALDRMQTFVEDHREVGTLIVWKVDRRQAERRRRSASPDGLPPIPSEARWA